jgi:two-component system, NtrC family, nitrogen regulation sensor histidine kinase NtrY
MASEPAVASAPGFARAFSWRVGWRLVALSVMLAATAWALMPPTLPATAAVAGALALWLAHGLWSEVRRTNLELARLLHALRHEDHSARFDGGAADAGFAELAGAVQGLLAQQRSQALAERSRHAQLLAVLEHVPTPLLAVDADERVTLLNHAARRLLGPHGAARVQDFAVLGPGLPAAMRGQDAPSASVELRPSDDAALRLRVSSSQALYDGRPQRLLALQPIQADLDSAETRLAADLVRVLTHEVMNSLTPVSSLLRSAADLADQLPADATTAPLRAALATAARRSEGLMQFVERYRTLAARPLVAHKAALPAALLAQSLTALFHAEWSQEKVTLDVVLSTDAPTLQADRDLLEPVLLNLLRNAAQAALSARAPGQPAGSTAAVRLSLQRASSGRTLIDIEDNGPGIPESLREEVFLPFFTTKPHGHGVGLSLARQTVLAHGGAIRVEDSPQLGGARLRIAL